MPSRGIDDVGDGKSAYMLLFGTDQNGNTKLITMPRFGRGVVGQELPLAGFFMRGVFYEVRVNLS